MNLTGTELALFITVICFIVYIIASMVVLESIVDSNAPTEEELWPPAKEIISVYNKIRLKRAENPLPITKVEQSKPKIHKSGQGALFHHKYCVCKECLGNSSNTWPQKNKKLPIGYFENFHNIIWPEESMVSSKIHMKSSRGREL